jgi:SAM-dependent methyltransferase
MALVTLTTEPTFVATPAAALQERLWSADPEGWALFSEPHNRPLFDAVLAAARVGSGTALLDIGCGSGLALELATRLGATVSGVDISVGLLRVANDRVPTADLRRADIQHLPYPDESFDAAIAVNAFQFAEDPVAAIAEAGRVLKSGGRLAIGMFAEPERAESTAVHVAMSTLTPPERETEHSPYALSAAGNLEAALEAVGFAVKDAGEVECVWAYDSATDAVRGLIGSAGGTRAVEGSDRGRVEAVIRRALEPFTNAEGRIAMRNTFRWIVAARP